MEQNGFGALDEKTLNKKRKWTLILLQLQSDLGYPATLGPAHIRISDLAGYGRYALTQQVQLG